MTTREIKERPTRRHEADWVRNMKEHYAKTGTYRPEDLRRLLGDPTQRAEIKSERSMPSYFAI